jgi:methylase of polypeptide subunit release factors
MIRDLLSQLIQPAPLSFPRDQGTSEVIDWVGQLAAGLPPRRILDLGSGTGTGAIALARRFQDADVIALDLSAEPTAGKACDNR